MVHQSLVTRPAVPSRTAPPESHTTRDVLDVFGSRDNVIREHFQRVLNLSAPAMIAVFAVYATLVDMALCQEHLQKRLHYTPKCHCKPLFFRLNCRKRDMRTNIGVWISRYT